MTFKHLPIGKRRIQFTFKLIFIQQNELKLLFFTLQLYYNDIGFDGAPLKFSKTKVSSTNK